MRGKLAALFLAAVLTAAPGAAVCDLTAMPPDFLDAMTTCSVGDAVEVRDVTAEFTEKTEWDIPEKAARGYVFSLEVREDAAFSDGSAVTAADCIGSLEDALSREDCPARLRRLETEVPREVRSLREAGLYSAEQALAEGHTLFVDMDGFWCLDAGWQPVSSRTRLRDWAIPTGLNEMYVSPGYLYQRYLCTGAQYQRQQRDFVGVGEMASRTGLAAKGSSVLLIFSRPTTESVVEVDLQQVTLCRDGISCGPYLLEGDTLRRSSIWWGSFPFDAEVIHLETKG